MYKSFIKPLIGKTLSLIGLLVCSIPMIIIAIAIKLDSKGPVFFRQARLGKGQKTFRIFKFRTMCVGAYEMGGVVTSANDARITKVGAFLRRSSLDELPQMFNILKGEMAIIGPRPILLWEFEPYMNKTLYRKRYDVTPGMFCTVDVFDRAAERDIQMEFDVDYASKQSLFVDFKTFFGIMSVVFTGKGVYKDEGPYKNR